jgi:Uma2 family endonuclease
MSTRTELVTAEELLRLPDDGLRRELIAGELKETTPSGHEHGYIAMNFSGPLHRFVKEKDLGAVFAAETGFLLATDPDTVRAPDIAFVSLERLLSVPKASDYFPGAPDLAVEVISPSDTYSEVEEKVEAWLHGGCRMVVVVNPRNRTLKVYRTQTDLAILSVDDSFEGGDLLPGFQLPVSRIF